MTALFWAKYVFNEFYLVIKVNMNLLPMWFCLPIYFIYLYICRGRGSHIGNPQLCGNPLPTNCSSLSPGNVNQGRKHEDGVNEDDDKTERLCLYGSIALGYITGFWLVCGSLMLKRSWRYAYFKFVFDVCVLISVNLAYAKRRFGLERNWDHWRKGRQQQ